MICLYPGAIQGRTNMKKLTSLTLVVAALSGCTTADAVKTSRDTAIIQSNAAPVCGGIGAMKAAYKQAAIETIREGFDKFIVFNGAAQNNVSATQMPGHYNTYGNYNGYGSWSATTTYQPGPIIMSGTHDQSLAIKMFKNGDPGSADGIDARQALGPKWPQIVKNGIMVCN